MRKEVLYTYLGANAHRGDYEMSGQVDAQFEGARKIAQKFINARYPEEIVFTSGSTMGLNEICIMLTSQYLKDGDAVLTCQSEHASSILPWMKASKKIELQYIPLDSHGKITLENVEKVLSKVSKEYCEQLKSVLVTLEISQEMAFRAYEELRNIQVTDNGKLLCHVEVTDINWFISYVLSYGSYIRILEPVEIKEKVMQEIKKMNNLYGGNI